MRDFVTTLLDTIGLLLLAAGAAAALWPQVGYAALAAAGVVVLAGSWLASGGTNTLARWAGVAAHGVIRAGARLSRRGARR